MRGAGVRLEAMRFGLLVVLTVALATVAVRIHSSPATHDNAGPVSRPTVQPSGQLVQPTVQPSVRATKQTAPPSSTGADQPGPVSSGGAASQDGSGSAIAPQQLPVTGWGDTVRLGALSFIFITAGALSLRVAGPRRRRRHRR